MSEATALSIRPEAPADRTAIRALIEAAFGQPDEADLVDALREAARPFLSFVAEHQGTLVGHLCFSPVTVGGEEPPVLGLAPVAVLPAWQRQGVGSALVRHGLAACRAAGFDAVFVLGHPDYYPRFDFVPAAPRGLPSIYPVPDDVFLVAELRPGALDGLRGTVRYHAAFSRFG